MEPVKRAISFLFGTIGGALLLNIADGATRVAIIYEWWFVHG